MGQTNRPVPARHVVDFDHCEAAGDYFITEPNPHEGNMRRLSFICPCGCGDLCGIKIRDDGRNEGGAWGWNGDADKPTVTPSIRIYPGEHWHGYLTDGIFVSI